MKFNKKFTIMAEKFISTCYQPNVCVLSFGAAIFPSLTTYKKRGLDMHCQKQFCTTFTVMLFLKVHPYRFGL